MTKEYFLGFDIGTDSIGYAVTDDTYSLCRFRGRDMWGARLFDSGNDASERRAARCSRRRVDRRTARINLLQQLLDEEIALVDKGFFARLKESFYQLDDRSVRQPFTLFNDINYTDKEHNIMFPTIYHLRAALIEPWNKKYDIRLVYLAIAHILKKRGHFLLEEQSLDAVKDFTFAYSAFVECLEKNIELDFETDHMSQLSEILKSEFGCKAKYVRITDLIGKGTKQKQAFINLLVGAKVKLFDLFDDEKMKEFEKKDIEFKGATFETNYDTYASTLSENQFDCILAAKSVYDWSMLSNILKGESSISKAKVNDYETHAEDLKKLKEIIKIYGTAQEYSDMFKEDKKSLNNYVGYIGKSKAKNNKSCCIKEDFYSAIKKVIEKYPESDLKKDILDKIALDNFIPRLATSDNGIIPYQLHLYELEKILNNAKNYYDSLSVVDESGLSMADKIISLHKFRVPYYVGPLGKLPPSVKESDSHAWLERKEEGRIFPWNIAQKVDLDKTAENFIVRMTSKCTYIKAADVLPKSSILYSKFMVLNEINNIKLDSVRIDNGIKKAIYNDLFCNYQIVTLKRIKEYLLAKGVIEKSTEITGIDGNPKASLKSQIDIERILDLKLCDSKEMLDLAERVIFTNTVFSDSKKLIEQRLQNEFGSVLSSEQIKQLSKLKFSGWGSLSKEFLTEIEGINKDEDDGRILNIIDCLYENNENLMELLKNDNDFIVNLQKRNAENMGQLEFTYNDCVAPLYCSPTVKRGIWQSLLIAKEIEGIMGSAPKKIFIEVTRADGEKARTVKRKEMLMDLYKSCKSQSDNFVQDLVKRLETHDDAKLRQKKLFLYYTQMGRCMYSGERIDFGSLFNNNLYDIDHIYPRSLTKDDSLDNTVLVKAELNRSKSDVYPISPQLKTQKVMDLWKMLYNTKSSKTKQGFISKKKFERLMGNEPLSDEKLAGFINRQLVETSQSSKAVAEVLKTIFPESKIVYSKAGSVSEFRKAHNFTKVRELNDYHHAKDAYLNIVVGNVFNVRFTENPINFLKTKVKYTLNDKIYNFDICRGDVYAWKRGNDGTIKTVNKVMASNRIQYTCYSFETKGLFSDMNPLKKGNGQLQLKTTDEKMLIDKYGGYNKVGGAYFVLVKYDLVKMKKNETVRETLKTIEFVPIYLTKQIECGTLDLSDYLKSQVEKELKDGVKLENFTVLINKIKKYTLFNVGGFPMHLTGRTGSSLEFAPAVQLVIDDASEKYLKQIINVVAKIAVDKDYELKQDHIADWAKITKDKNLALYDMLSEKANNSIYSLRPSKISVCFIDGREKFIELALEEQCMLVFKCLDLFKCRKTSADLVLVGGKGRTGTLRINKNITGKNIRIINQSITGLYSNEVDLSKL